MWRKDATLARLTVIATLISLTVDGTAAGSCSSAKLCCQGRDSGCVIQKESPNAIIESPRDKPCYCDHACLKLADCCDDFKETCGVVDCAVSEWSPWSPCDNGCGSGTQRRSRLIEISEKNGGKHCPRLDQVRTCRSFQTCHAGIRSQPHAKSVTLLALFPGDGNTTDVRIKDRIIDKSGSCVAFTIVRVSRGCSRISDLLSEGSLICVERPGNESLDKYVGIGRWKLSADITGGDNRRGRSTNSTCHGKWISDSRLLVDCHDPRCAQSSRMPPHTSQLFRDRSRRGAITNAAVSSADKVVRRRRRGRRRKRSKRRRRDAAVAER
ncbi:somatomedin-B and thrombospondin type-1 domain-containing protein [Linepithema humile]|uniref:somatomedin-B and thrombospondin type-1 domain-containing protein n=1 Tax=Linepithema humile TaxID=83485 RepID=UPI00062383F9|nr:PREDICTED: somatomedin-B and thrombospondin type-1 domain-containing protein [Linepithema humile]XP_012216934.1 PREDICTED: somatomedin-B and thrombospondin type-1 domain-containing protein [Linepithema humile]